MKFIDQSPTHLQLNLYEGDVDLSPLHILKEQFVTYTPTLSVHVGIIGASHFVKVQHGAHFFTEVFACNHILPTSGKQLYQATFFQLNRLQMNRCTGMQYEFQHQIHPLQAQVTINQLFAQSCSNLSSEGLYLTFSFPSTDSLKTGAKTSLLVDFDHQQSIIHTFSIHEYPQSDTIVTNRSVFRGEVEGGGR